MRRISPASTTQMNTAAIIPPDKSESDFVATCFFGEEHSFVQTFSVIVSPFFSVKVDVPL